MDKVEVYKVRLYDVRNDEFLTSRRMGNCQGRRDDGRSDYSMEQQLKSIDLD